jgi:hypothetical protein
LLGEAVAMTRRAVVLGHGHRGLAGRARRSVDQHGLPGGDAAQGLERGKCGGPVHDQAQRLLGCPASRHRHRRGRGQDHVLGESPVSDADDASPRSWAGHRLAHRHDLAGGLETRQIRWLRAAQERAVGPRDVGEVDTGGGDPDQDLALARARYRRVGDQTYVLRTLQRGLLQSAHGGGNAHGNQLSSPGFASSRPASSAGRTVDHVDLGHRRKESAAAEASELHRR